MYNIGDVVRMRTKTQISNLLNKKKPSDSNSVFIIQNINGTTMTSESTECVDLFFELLLLQPRKRSARIVDVLMVGHTVYYKLYFEIDPKYLIIISTECIADLSGSMYKATDLAVYKSNLRIFKANFKKVLVTEVFGDTTVCSTYSVNDIRLIREVDSQNNFILYYGFFVKEEVTNKLTLQNLRDLIFKQKIVSGNSTFEVNQFNLFL